MSGTAKNGKLKPIFQMMDEIALEVNQVKNLKQVNNYVDVQIESIPTAKRRSV